MSTGSATERRREGALRAHGRKPQGRGRRARALAALLLVAVLAVLVIRLVDQHVPPVRLARVLPRTALIAGPPPRLAWTREGQAAVEVEGLGSLGTAGMQTPVPIASVAKMMTAYLTLRQHPLADGGFTIEITPAEAAEERQRAGMGESVVPVRAGERLTERQALQALLVPSANNIAALLAVEDAGSTQAFVARMNATAKGLGMGSTTYTDPSGFEGSTVSTASDQLELARVAMREPGFAAIVDERSVTLPVAGTVSNYDGLVGEDGYVGVKTGSDTAAGGCLVFAKRILLGGRRLTVMGVVLGQRQGEWVAAALASARALGDSAAAAVRIGTVLPAGKAVLRAQSADGTSTVAVTGGALRALGWGGMRVALDVSIEAPGETVQAGQRLGTLRVLGRSAVGGRVAAAGRPGAGGRSGAGGGSGAARTALLARTALVTPSLGWRLGRVF